MTKSAKCFFWCVGFVETAWEWRFVGGFGLFWLCVVCWWLFGRFGGCFFWWLDLVVDSC